MLIGWNQAALVDMFKLLELKGRNVSMVVNEAKTEHIKMTAPQGRRMPTELELLNYFIKYESFCYLKDNLNHQNIMS